MKPPRPFAALACRLLLLVPMLMAGLCLAGALPLDHLEHRRWIAADGGPSQVGAMAQTRDGYLWLGTNESLFRFDGFRFVRHEAVGIVSALLAVDNDLWVGLRAGGIDVARAAGVQRYKAGDDGLPAGVIYGLARDRDNAIWAAADDGLARFDGTRWQHISTAWHFPGRKARAVFVDRDGVLWAANENRLFYLRPGTRAFIDTGVAVDWASQLAQAPDGAIWLVERYSGRLHRAVLAGGAVTSSSLRIDAPSNGLLFDRSGNLWISTMGSGVQFIANPVGATSVAARQPFTARDGLSADYIWPMLEDKEGNLWIGTNAGLDRLRRRTLMPAGFPASALNFALAAGGDGSLWAGSGNRPAMRLHSDGGRLDILTMPAPATCAMRDADGAVWMGGPGGIWRSRDGKLVRVATLPAGTPADSSVRAMARDGAGDLWVSVNRLGLFRLQAGRWQAMTAPGDTPDQLMPVSAASDVQGRPWFGYRNNLLVMRDGASERRWGAADGIDIGHVTAILHDRQRTWIGGQHGIAYFDASRFHRLRLPDNGLFQNIYAIIDVPLADGSGHDLWVHAKSGIFQLSAAELQRALVDPKHQIRYRSYDLMGGLANDPYQVLPLPSAVRGADGRLYFSTSNGVVWIDPNRPNAEDAGPTAVIESVTVDGARMSAGVALNLAPNTQRIVLDYTALSLSSPESLHFRYRLDGYDDEWQDAGRQREAVYTALGPGAYRFRVLAYNKDGLPSAQEATLSFAIPPAFYERPLFLLSLGVLVAGALWLLYRANLRRAAENMRARLEERHGERERIARELHDTLLQGVHGLMLRFQAVAHTIAPDHPARQGLEQALDRADGVLVEGRDRVRDLRSSTVGRGALHEAFRTVGAEMRHAGGAAFNLTVRGAPIALHDAVREEVYCIGREAIANAFAHAGAKRISVELDFSASRFQLKISDDGCGIDPAWLGPAGRPHHYGLRGMAERAEKIGATFSIVSAPAQGSEIRLALDAARAYRQPPPGRTRWWRLSTRKQGTD